MSGEPRLPFANWPSPYNNLQYEYEKVIGRREQSGDKRLKRLKPMHRQMIALHVGGISGHDIALATGWSEGAVYRVLNDPLSREYIDHILHGAELDLNALLPNAVGVLRRGLNSEDDRTALIAADKFFRATGRYEKPESSRETAEDVIAKALQIARVQANTIHELARPNPLRVVDGRCEEVEDGDKGDCE